MENFTECSKAVLREVKLAAVLQLVGLHRTVLKIVGLIRLPSDFRILDLMHGTWRWYSLQHIVLKEAMLFGEVQG